MEIVRFAFGAVLLIVSAVLSMQLWKGRWLFLIAQPEKRKKETFYPEGTHKSARRVAWVMVGCFAVVATLLVFEMTKMTGNSSFGQVAATMNNIALVGYCIVLLWAVLSCRGGRGLREHLEGGGYRVIIVLIGSCAALTAMGLLFVS